MCRPGQGSLYAPAVLMKTPLMLACLLAAAHADAPLHHLQIGDGTSLEFDFPPNTRGVIVMSSCYRGSAARRLRVRSLHPDVISIIRVSETQRTGTANRYVISIRSGSAGTAALHVQLLELQRNSDPVLLEERDDYSIKVASGGNDTRQAHFTESPVLFALLPLVLVNKCAFGCKVEVEVLLALLRRPTPLVLGVACQFLIMPLYAYALSRLASLPNPLALGLVITCSAPGGGGGYLYSLLLGGDVTLAISMTLVSTLAAAAAMPLSSALFGWLLGVQAALHLPFVKILGTLLFVAVPVSLGMLVKLYSPSVSHALLTLIHPFSFVLIAGGMVVAYQTGSSLLLDVQSYTVSVGVTVPVFGLLVGFGTARLAGLPACQRRTVGIEVGVQNSLLALAVVQLSFQRAEADYVSQVPLLVALSSTSEALLLLLCHLAHRRLCLPALHDC